MSRGGANLATLAGDLIHQRLRCGSRCWRIRVTGERGLRVIPKGRVFQRGRIVSGVSRARRGGIRRIVSN